MLHPGPVSMTVLFQHCAECSPKVYDDLFSCFCLPRTFHRDNLQTILLHPFLFDFLWTCHSLLPSQGFRASTATHFASSISSPLPLASATSGWPKPLVTFGHNKHSFLHTSPATTVLLGACSLLPSATASPGHSFQALLLSIPVSPPEKQPKDL